MDINWIVLLVLLPSFLYFAGYGSVFFKAIEKFKDKKAIRDNKVVILRHKWFYNFKLLASLPFYVTLIIGFIPIVRSLMALGFLGIPPKSVIAVMSILEEAGVFIPEETDEDVDMFMGESMAKAMEAFLDLDIEE